jgi:hypothetical protein
VWAAKRFNPYIYGRHATFVTDHQPLVTMRSLKKPMSRIGRLLYKIQDLDYDLVCQPGSSNCTADLLSRPPVAANSVELRVESCINWSLEQSVDFAIRRIKSGLVSAENRSEILIPDEVPQKNLWNRLREKLDVQNGVLVVCENGFSRIVVPQQVIPVVLNLHHDFALAGHRDFDKTYDAISSRYFWPGMHNDVKVVSSATKTNSGRATLGDDWYRWHRTLASDHE